MKKVYFVITLSLFINKVNSQHINKSVSPENSTTFKSLELPNIKVVPIRDTQFDRQYELYIKLPEKYSENTNIRYPVLYFTDAMWHIEVLSGSADYLLENVILVGISWQNNIEEALIKEVGAHVSRFRDYTVIPFSNSEYQAKFQSGQAHNHLNFIRNDVIKYVENNYRTDPNNRSYFGYSLGGLFGAYVLLSQPNTFKNYIIGSPSLDGDIPYLSELASNETLKHNDLNANIFISYGSLEKELSVDAEKFITILKTLSEERLSLTHVVIEGNHQTAFPMTGVNSLTWLSNLIKE